MQRSTVAIPVCAVLSVALMTGCGGGHAGLRNRVYTTSEVRRAFASEGFGHLKSVVQGPETTTEHINLLAAPHDPVLIFVFDTRASLERAAETWKGPLYRDSVIITQSNLGAIITSGKAAPPTLRPRINAALARLGA